MYACVYIHKCMRVCIYIHTHTFMYICMYVCMYVYGNAFITSIFQSFNDFLAAILSKTRTVVIGCSNS